jgi:hypothetical protein
MPVIPRNEELLRKMGIPTAFTKFAEWNTPSRPRCFLAKDSVASLWPDSSLSTGDDHASN